MYPKRKRRRTKLSMRVDVKENQMERLKIGDKVRTSRGDGEIVFVLDKGSFPYLVGIHGYDGHSGGPYEKYAKARGYVRECMWACDEELVKIRRTKRR